MYTNVKVNISDGQKEKLKQALAGSTQLSLHLSHSDLAGEHTIALTQSQLNKLNKAKETGKGVNIKMSKTQVRHNMKVHGGILSLPAGLASQAIPFITGRVLPALGVGALSSLASTGVQKLMGNGLYIKKRGCVCEVETDGKRLLFEPANGKVLAKYGHGLYLKREGKLYDGSGLLLGPNSSFRNVPILCL